MDLIVRNPAAKVDRPRGVKPDINPPAPADVVRMITEASKPLALFLASVRSPAPGGPALRPSLVRLDLDTATIRWTREAEQSNGQTWPGAGISS